MGQWLRTHDGVVSTSQAAQLGVSEGVLRWALRAGRLGRVSDGVFVDRWRPSEPRMAIRAALVAIGRGSVVSHRSAAWLWGLVADPPARPSILIPRSRHVNRSIAVVHQTCHPVRPLRRDGFPVTDPSRTLIDLAGAGAGDKALDALVDRALSLRLVTESVLEAATRPNPALRLRGAAILRRRLCARGHLGPPHPSVLESRMARLFRKLQDTAMVPAPDVEVVWLDGKYRLDYAWPAVGLAVEVDGYVWHSSTAQMDYDCARRNQLSNIGWRFLVYSWIRVTSAPDQVIAEIAETYGFLVAQTEAPPGPQGPPRSFRRPS